MTSPFVQDREGMLALARAPAKSAFSSLRTRGRFTQYHIYYRCDTRTASPCLASYKNTTSTFPVKKTYII